MSTTRQMQEPTGTLNTPENAMPDADADREPSEERRRGAIKFVFASGSRPLDSYTIKRGIGAGGFGEVYYATSDAGKEVALKHIQRNLDVELRGVKQCLNLKHPNLLALYDIKYDDEDRAWVVMEYVAGESLQDVIERNPNGMPLDQVQRWFRGIAAGVAYLHDHGVVHRDLKPGNIFLDEGVVKIGDYGLSKFISCSRRSGQTESVGTFHYMAPEIGLGKYGKEIDVYALGIMLYEMLSGRVPYDGESSQEIIMKHLTASPNLDVVPVQFRNVIGNSLAKDPQTRPSSVEAMLGSVFQHTGEASVTTPTAPDVAVANDAGPVVRPIESAVPNHGLAETNAAQSPIDAQTVEAQAQTNTPEEPIARAVHDLLVGALEAWDRANLGTFSRFVLLLLGVFLLLTNAPLLVPFGLALGIAYACYLVVRAIIIAPESGRDTQPAAAPTAAKDPVAARRPNVLPLKVTWEELAREKLRLSPFNARLTGTLGSMIMAALTACVLCLLMTIVGNDGTNSSLIGWAPLYMWMTLTSTIGAWSILIFATRRDGLPGDPALRRFVMLAVGLAIGGCGYMLSQALVVEPTYILVSSPRAVTHYPTSLFGPDGTANVFGYLVYFAGLFLVPSWWRQVDPLRGSRLSFWSTFVTVLWAILLFSFLPFPRGFMIAAATSISAQLSAPWLPTDQRKLLRKTASMY